MLLARLRRVHRATIDHWVVTGLPLIHCAAQRRQACVDVARLFPRWLDRRHRREVEHDRAISGIGPREFVDERQHRGALKSGWGVVGEDGGRGWARERITLAATRATPR